MDLPIDQTCNIDIDLYRLLPRCYVYSLEFSRSLYASSFLLKIIYWIDIFYLYIYYVHLLRMNNSYWLLKEKFKCKLFLHNYCINYPICLEFIFWNLTDFDLCILFCKISLFEYNLWYFYVSQCIEISFIIQLKTN